MDKSAIVGISCLFPGANTIRFGSVGYLSQASGGSSLE